MKTYHRIGLMRSKFWIQVGLMFAVFISLGLPAGAASGDDLPESAFVSGFMGERQHHNLSCEARSAVDLAQFWGISISENEFLTSLPLSENPDDGFVGNYDDYWGNIPPLSYGVHAEPVARELRHLGLKAHSEIGITLDDLRAQINEGNPVIVWVIGQMWRGTSDKIELSNEDQVVVAANEHTMVLTGYTTDIVQVFDPYYGVYETYNLKAFERSWAVLGNMAVTVTGLKDDDEALSNSDEPTVTPDQANATTDQSQPTQEAPRHKKYTVQRGDYLIALAKEFNVDWRWLVQVNDIPYPWTIYPGQVLKIK
jgi:uncharacterized protein YvpB